MNTIKLLVTLFLTSLIVACQPQVTKEVIRETAPVGPQNTAEGGADPGGGGNGINGRPIESYAVSMMKVDSFTEFILPIIREVSQTHPRFASDMAHIALNRNWFFVPVTLNKIPSHAIGVSFGDKDSEQMALQNLRAVWLDSNLFQSAESTNESRAQLVLHEILMGIRLMRYKSSLDNCYSEVALQGLSKESAVGHSKLRDKCALTYGFNDNDKTTPGFSSSKLTSEDYDNIRELGLELWNAKGAISKIQLDAWLRERNFRSY